MGLCVLKGKRRGSDNETRWCGFLLHRRTLISSSVFPHRVDEALRLYDFSDIFVRNPHNLAVRTNESPSTFNPINLITLGIPFSAKKSD